jgi:hypothetical protein
VFKAESLRPFLCVGDVLGFAGAVTPALRACTLQGVIPDLHRQAYDVITLPLQEQGCHRGIDTAAHTDGNNGFA